MVILKSPKEIDKIKKSNEMVAEILSVLISRVEPGIDTLELNDISEKLARERRATPAFKGYRGYPFALCASANNVVVHGFPNKTPLKNGDILSLDFGILLDGYYGDAATTVAVGELPDNAKKLTAVTEDSLYLGIKHAVPDGRLTDISHAIQSYVEAAGFSVVRKFVGHGIGSKLHEDPQIPNFGKPGSGVRLKPGMTLAIEPMVNEKGPEIEILDDGWTAVTKDGALSAHYEHTIAVTDNGPVILSHWEGS